jgi:cbb3-type cytochrome oxidase subunit 3
MQYSYKTKIITLSTIGVIWFVFGALLILRGSVDIKELKTIKGDLEFYDIVTIPDGKRMIDVLSFKIVGYPDKTALYLNSRQDYESLIEKFKSKQPISIIYNSKGGIAADGYNLHIYHIKYGAETLIDYKKITSTDKKIGKILHIVGLIFVLPIIYVYRQKKRKVVGNS